MPPYSCEKGDVKWISLRHWAAAGFVGPLISRDSRLQVPHCVRDFASGIALRSRPLSDSTSRGMAAASNAPCQPRPCQNAVILNSLHDQRQLGRVGQIR